MANNNKATATKSIPTQNDLSKIIIAQVKDIDNILKVVIKSANNYGNFKSVVKPIDNYQNIVTHIFSEKGIIHSIISLLNNIKAKEGKENVKAVKSFVNSLHDLIEYIADKTAGVADIASRIDLVVFEKTYLNVITSLNRVLEILQGLKIKIFLPLKLFLVKFQFNMIKNFIEDIAETGDNMLSGLKQCLTAFAKFKVLEIVVTTLNTMITLVLSIRFRPIKLWWQLRQAKKTIKRLSKLIKVINQLDLDFNRVIRAVIALVGIMLVIKPLIKTIEMIRNVKIGLKFYWKIFVIKGAIKRIIGVINVFKKLDTSAIGPQKLKSFIFLFVILNLTIYLFRIIRGSKVGLKLWFKLLMMKTCISMLNSVILELKFIKFNKNHMLKLIKLIRFFKKIRTLFNIIVTSTAGAVLSVVSLIAITIAFAIMSGSLLLMIKLTNKIGRKLTPALFAKLLLIQTFVIQVSTMMLMLSLAALIGTAAIVPILLFFVMFAGVLGAITLISWLVTLAAPILTAAIIGFVIMTMVVLLMIAVIGVLKLLEIISLNPEKIKENVKAVLDTAMLVIDSIFNRSDETEEQESEKGWFAAIIGFVASSLGPIIQAIMAIAFLALIVVAISIIMLIAIQLRIIQMLDLDPNKIAENVKIVMDTSMLVIDAIFNRDDNANDNESDKSWIVSVLENFGGTLFTIVKAIMAVAFLATIIVAITLITIIAAQLRLLQGINLDYAKIEQNVGCVLDNATFVIEALFNRPDNNSNKSNKNWIVSLLEYIGGPIAKIAQAIMAVAFLAIAIGMIALIKVLAEQLKTIAEINLPKDITPKVNSILIAADQVIKALQNRKDTLNGQPNEKKKGFLKRFFGKLKGAIDMIASMAWVSSAIVCVGMVSQLAEHLTTINSAPDVSSVMTKVDEVCITADQVIANINKSSTAGDNIAENGRLGIMTKICDVIKSYGNISTRAFNKIETATKVYGEFLNKINSVEITKLETSAKIFEQMANFSNSIKGNFEKLAESINEDLMPVLEELKEIMEKVPTAIETNGANVSAAVVSTTVAPTTANVTAQVERENPGMNKKQVEQLVQTRLKEHANSAANSTASKIDELISLLKGYSGEHIVVQTI